MNISQRQKLPRLLSVFKKADSFPVPSFARSHTMSSIVSKKVCLLGDFNVGKTSLIRRFVECQFSDQYLSTVGVKISRKTVECNLVDYPKPMTVQMLIWDLEGNTKFKAITPLHLQGASSAVIVADASRQVTVEHISEHIQCFLSVNPKGSLIVALNKADLMPEDNLANILNSLSTNVQDKVMPTYATSAKTGLNVDQIFQKLAYQMLQSEYSTLPFK